MNEPKFTQSTSAFSMQSAVEINIRANIETIWSILTNAKDFPQWNSTVRKIEGQIKEGQQIRMHITGSSRVFALAVSDLVHNERMTWSSGSSLFNGVRTFKVGPHGDGTSDFKMEEHFSGLMLPLIKGSLPDFRQMFVTYASDLKKEAERSGSQSALRH
jgi:hypothetical protein